jgi:hypothetical protein
MRRLLLGLILLVILIAPGVSSARVAKTYCGGMEIMMMGQTYTVVPNTCVTCPAIAGVVCKALPAPAPPQLCSAGPAALHIRIPS